MPWSNVKEALKVTNIGDLSLGTVLTYLDLEVGGERDVGPYDDNHPISYYNKFFPTLKPFHT